MRKNHYNYNLTEGRKNGKKGQRRGIGKKEFLHPCLPLLPFTPPSN